MNQADVRRALRGGQPPSEKPRARRRQEQYARRNGYFWTACPIDGKWFGGQEWFGGGRATGPSSATAICPWCWKAGRGSPEWD